MKKYIVVRIHGIKAVETVSEKRKERASFPRPTVFRDKTKYTRKEKHRHVYDFD